MPNAKPALSLLPSVVARWSPLSVVVSQNHHHFPSTHHLQVLLLRINQLQITMPVAFDSIPQEVLENIAFYAVSSEPLGPPRELAPLLLVNRRLHAALSGASNPHLHSRIFACKFDNAALVRRLGPGAATARKLAAELRRRCVQLARLRDRLGCTLGELTMEAETTTSSGSNNNNNKTKKKKKKDGGDDDDDDDGGGGGGGGGGREDGMTEDGMRALHEMLWTAYVMMLENDGKNERQLREYAHLDDWLRTFWFAEDGASFARLEIRDNSWPPYNDLADVTMWLFWFLLKPGASQFFDFIFPLSPPPPLLFSSFSLSLSAAGIGPRVNGAFITYYYHIYAKYATQRTPRGILCVGRSRTATRNFHIEAVGPRRT
jgi:hypothetical protein